MRVAPERDELVNLRRDGRIERGGAVFELVERGEGAREDCLTSFRRHLGVITSFCARAPVREKSKDHQ